MAQRAKAAQACIDRFGGKLYEPGKRDCIILSRHALHQMGRAVGLDKIPDYRTEVGGLRALRKLGFSGLAEALDGIGLERIAPLRALAGDIVALPLEDRSGFDCALSVAVGNGRVIGFQDGIGKVLQPLSYVTAWRV